MNPSPAELSLTELGIREEHARSYDAEYAYLHGLEFLRAEAAFLRNLLDLHPDDVVLDIGCGTGRLLSLYAPICRRAYVVDRSPASLRVVQTRVQEAKLTNVVPLLRDVGQPFEPPEPVTRVLCVQVLQHVPSPEHRRQVVENAARALGGGGRAVFVDEADGWVRRLRGKVREVAEAGKLYFHPFRIREYKDTIASAGFSILRVRGLGVCYWTRYRVSPRVIVPLDILMSSTPGSRFMAKFLGVVATPGSPQSPRP